MLYCHCARSSAVPADAKTAALRALFRAGRPFRRVDDLCRLAATGDPILAEVARSESPVIVACYPRAVKWLFRRAGAALPERTRFVNMRELTADQVAAELAVDGPGKCDGCVSAAVERAARHLDRRAADAWVPWFPVVDYDRCVGCGKCRDFCIFGVFGAPAEGGVSVERPANCKTNCPACARICPEAAIIFPKYRAAPINGSEEEGDEPVRVDMASIAAGDVMALLRRRSEKAKRRFSAELDSALAEEERSACGCACSAEAKAATPGSECPSCGDATRLRVLSHARGQAAEPGDSPAGCRAPGLKPGRSGCCPPAESGE